MSSVVILGAGRVGAAVAHRLAERGRVRSVTLVDSQASGAAGKALDILQSGPVAHFDTSVTAAEDALTAVGAPVVVLADELEGGEWQGERALGLIARLVRAGVTAPVVCTGAEATWLLEACHAELKIPASRLIGTAASAMAGAVRAWAGLELGLSSVDLTVVGRPPDLIVGWSVATAHGALLTERIAAHRLLALSDQLSKLWPPGPFAVASATVPVIHGLLSGSRRLLPALTVVDGDLGPRGRAVLLPVSLAPGRVQSHVMPSLSPQERTELLNSLAG